MKLSKLSQLVLVSTIGLLVATLLTACNLVTIDLLFVASSVGSGTGSAGQIQTFAVDAASGAIRPGAATVASGGTAPVAMVITSDYTNLYVAHATTSTSGLVVHFAVSSEGVLTKADTVTTSFMPASLAVNAAGTFLYVAGGTSPSELAVYPLSAGKIGNLSSLIPLTLTVASGDALVPTGVNVKADNSAVYVTAYDKDAYNPGGSVTSSVNPGWVFGFTASSTAQPTVIAGSPWKAGVMPSAIISDPTNRFVYVTDYASNELIGYSIQTGSVLKALVNGPFKTGNEPSAITIDPRGLYIYVTDALDSSLSCYSITLATGTPTIISSSTASSSTATDTQPVGIVVDPAMGRLVYTVNYLGNSVSGFHLDPATGVLNTVVAMPYPSGYRPTAMAIMPHGNHSVQSVTP